MNPIKWNNRAMWNWAVSTDGPVPPSSSWSLASPPFPGRRAGEGLSCHARNPTLLTSGPWWLREVPTHGLGLWGDTERGTVRERKGISGWERLGPHVHIAAQLCSAHKSCIHPWALGLENSCTPSGEDSMAAWPGAVFGNQSPRE